MDVATDPTFIALLLQNLRESLTVEEKERACGWNSGRPSRLLDEAGEAAGACPRG